MSEKSAVARFYDQLAADYHLIYADWDASVSRQGAVLNTMIRTELDLAGASVLDCSCGIGTQAIGLGGRGHRITGTDVSRSAVIRASAEAVRRGVRLPTAVADMRRLPFPEGRFDVVVSADNSVPHLLTPGDVRGALAEMRRVLRGGGLLVLSTRPYDEIVRTRPSATPPSLSSTVRGRSSTFQLWHWHEDGEHYDLEHFQLVSDGVDWTVRVRRTTYWALTSRQLVDLAIDAGFTGPRWLSPADSGFFQPILVARTPTLRSGAAPDGQAPSIAGRDRERQNS